ncbi:MAG: PQQ-binding-like beta-propeller repeat protein [Chromatiaceae bacterium]
MNLTRRRCLQGLCLGLVGAPFLARANRPWIPTLGEVRLMRRWATGNQNLAPAALIEGHILFAGEQTLGLIDPTAATPLWVRPHQLPGGAVFRPRAAAGTAICAGRRELGVWGLESGEPIWRRGALRQLGVPCLDGDVLFLGDGHELIALDLASGSPHWRFTAIADTQISYAPVATDDTVLIGPGDGRLYALDRTNGQTRWVLNRSEDWQYLRQLQVAGNILVAGGYTEKLYGIDLTSGTLLWSFSAGNFINSHHVAGDTAFLWSPTGWLYAIDIHSGEVRWRHRTTGYRGGPQDWASLMAELTSRDGRLYALDLAHVLHVLDQSQGEEIARYRLPAPARPFVLPLTAQEAIVGGNDGDLWLLALGDVPRHEELAPRSRDDGASAHLGHSGLD